MTFFSSNLIAHGSTNMTGWEVTIPLKSRFDGDVNEIRSVQPRVLNGTVNRIASVNSTHSVGAQNVQIYPRYRPYLMHCVDGGLRMNAGSVTFEDDGADVNQATIGSVSMLVMPTSSGFTVSAGGTTATISISGSNYTISGAGATYYINGSPWSGNEKFPFPRLVTVVFNSLRTTPLTLSGTGVVSGLSVTSHIMTAQDVQFFAQIAYRKPISSLVATDSLTSTPLSDTPVAVPNTWQQLTVS